MTVTTNANLEPRENRLGLNASSASTSAVSWASIFAGAAAAASLSLILLILGVGLGLTSVSPWSQEGISATTFGVSSIVWLTVTQLVSSALGGYLAGRLRTKWVDIHTDEVYFRDTAHGFLSWAVASLVTAMLLTSVIGSILNGGMQAGASMASGMASTATNAVGGLTSGGNSSSDENGPLSYFVDSLFRTEGKAADTNTTSVITGEPTMSAPQDSENRVAQEVAEVTRIMVTNLSRSQALPAEDAQYVGRLVAKRTGLSQQEAEKRVTETYNRAQEKMQELETTAKDAADKARKASAYAAMWTFVSLLVGAFVASLAATYGGRKRDA